MMGYDISEALDAIDPAGLDYSEWVQVGMALHAEGHPFEEWDSWSMRDAARYRGDGGMRRKWAGFGHSPNPVGGGTIVQMAKDRGWCPGGGMGEALSWDDTEVSGARLDPSWVEPVAVDEPKGEWHGWRELVRYLEALFDSNEIVGYVTESWDKDGRWVPKSGGPHDRTAGELIAALQAHGDDLGASIGEPDPMGGAWIRFNPLDGRGVRNDNVAEYRFALVESDSLEIERQRGIIEELQLPVAALVHSGGKSLHAIVRIDAKDYDEYRKRVDYLYAVCNRYGLKVDTQNKNPSRLSRMPGVYRNGRKQWLVGTGLGLPGWDEWREWVESVNDDLPEPESLADVWDSIPELAPALIGGVLRQGHKMLVSGPSKAGKSFALIELCAAIAEGREWMGWGCAQGRVLYVNLELDRVSCLHRFRDVYAALGWEPANVRNIDVWNLRGKSKPMDKLAPSLIRRALKTRPIAVVIDPIYKVITGDENSADQMAAFCNQFDRVADALGCAVIYCHHHSKGSQGQKRSMDRASGSGVFARDPDAILDIIALEEKAEDRARREDEAAKAACSAFLGRSGISPDPAPAAIASARAEAAAMGEGAVTELLRAVNAARCAERGRTPWRIEGTLREFPGFEPVNLWFEYPVHRVGGPEMALMAADGSEEAARQKGTENAARRRRRDQDEKVRLIRDAMADCARDKVEPTRAAVLERIGEFNGKGVTKAQLRSWTRAEAEWCPIKVADDGRADGLLADREEGSIMEGW